MVDKKPVAALIFSIAWMMQSCSLPQLNKEAPAVNEVKAHAKFRISLPENHSTGALWQLDQNYDRSVVEELNAVWHGNEKGIDFNFKTLSAGQTTLNLTLRKYKDTLNVKSFVVRIPDN